MLNTILRYADLTEEEIADIRLEQALFGPGKKGGIDPPF